MQCKHAFCCAGQLEESLAIGDFPPGDYSLDITVIDVYGQSVAHPTLTFTRPDLLEVECSVHDSLTIDCTSSTVVESQMCSIDDGSRFDCSLPRDIDELARTFNLTSGDHNLSVMTVDEFGQLDNSLVIFTVRKLNHNCVFIVSASVYIHVPPMALSVLFPYSTLGGELYIRILQAPCFPDMYCKQPSQ